MVYWSLLELGPLTLSSEEAWFCSLAKRSSEVNKLQAGISQVFGSVIKAFFCNAHFDMVNAGIVLKHPNGDHFRLFLRLGMILNDGGAHKLVFHCKGDGGTRMCMRCRNLIAEVSNELLEDGSNMLTCSHVFESDLDFATNEDILGSVRRLAARFATMTPSDFKLMEQAVGFNHQPFLSQAMQMPLNPQSCQVAVEARIAPIGSAHRGDVVLLLNNGVVVECAEVWLHTAVEGVPCTLVSTWPCNGIDLKTGAAEWLEQKSPELVDTADILCTLIYTRPRAGVVRTLIPCNMKRYRFA